MKRRKSLGGCLDLRREKMGKTSITQSKSTHNTAERAELVQVHPLCQWVRVEKEWFTSRHMNRTLYESPHELKAWKYIKSWWTMKNLMQCSWIAAQCFDYIDIDYIFKWPSTLSLLPIWLVVGLFWVFFSRCRVIATISECSWPTSRRRVETSPWWAEIWSTSWRRPRVDSGEYQLVLQTLPVLFLPFSSSCSCSSSASSSLVMHLLPLYLLQFLLSSLFPPLFSSHYSFSSSPPSLSSCSFISFYFMLFLLPPPLFSSSYSLSFLLLLHPLLSPPIPLSPSPPLTGFIACPLSSPLHPLFSGSKSIVESIELLCPHTTKKV